jgi:hypothetical protein
VANQSVSQSSIEDNFQLNDISSLTRGIQNLLRQEPEREQKLIPGAKFGKETVAEHAGGQNGSHIMVRRPDSGVLRMLSAQPRSGLLRLAQACSGSTPACSPSAQVKAAVAHVRRLKRNQRKGKLILSLWVSHQFFSSLAALGTTSLAPFNTHHI